MAAEVRVADLEPVASFIAQAVRADALLRLMTPAQAALLPDCAVNGMAVLQHAVNNLRRAGCLDPVTTVHTAGARL